METGCHLHHLIKLILKAMLNVSSNLYKSEWLDLVFKNRNKNYGAYALRAESAGTTTRALLIAGPVFILLFAGPMIYKRLHPVAEAPADRTVILDLAQLAPPKELQKPREEKIELPKAEPVSKKIKTVALPSRPIVVDDQLAPIDPPTIEQVKNAAIGPLTQDGLETNIASVSATGDGNGSTGGSPNGAEGTAPDNTIYEGGVEVYPEFEGGMKGWEKFLRRNLRYPEMAQETGIQGKVFVSFVIEKDGSVTDVKVVRGIGGGCDEEAMRVIKKSPKWKPGRQNSQSVRVRYNMPLSFNIAP